MLLGTLRSVTFLAKIFTLRMVTVATKLPFETSLVTRLVFLGTTQSGPWPEPPEMILWWRGSAFTSCLYLHFQRVSQNWLFFYSCVKRNILVIMRETLPLIGTWGSINQMLDSALPFMYNNIMYAVAGQTAEVLTGQLWEDLLQEELLEPLGMHNTTFYNMAAPDVWELCDAVFPGSGRQTRLGTSPYEHLEVRHAPPHTYTQPHTYTYTYTYTHTPKHTHIHTRRTKVYKVANALGCGEYKMCNSAITSIRYA